MILAWRQISSKKVSGLFEQFIMALGIWTILQTAALAYARGSMAPRYEEIMAMGSLANFAALVLLLQPLYDGVRRRAPIVLGAVALVVCVSLAGFHRDLPPSLLAMHTWWGIEEENTASYVATGDTSYLVDKPFPRIPYPNTQRLIAVLEDPLVRRILPAGIRAPIFKSNRRPRVYLRIDSARASPPAAPRGDRLVAG